MTKFDFYPREVRERFELAAAEYTFQQDEPTPWTPLRMDLKDARAVLVTTAGLRLKTQHEFRPDRSRGCADVREIGCSVSKSDIAFDFTTYDPREAEKDLNVLAPVDRLKDLVDRRVLGGLHDTFFSFYGLCADVDALKLLAHQTAARLQADCAFVFPADFLCNQTAGLVSREFERSGIATVTLVTVREIAAQVRVPRPLFLNHPFGRTLGKAHASAQQRAIVLEMARALKSHDRPARIVDLPMHWTE